MPRTDLSYHPPHPSCTTPRPLPKGGEKGKGEGAYRRGIRWEREEKRAMKTGWDSQGRMEGWMGRVREGRDGTGDSWWPLLAVKAAGGALLAWKPCSAPCPPSPCSAAQPRSTPHGGAQPWHSPALAGLSRAREQGRRLPRSESRSSTARHRQGTPPRHTARAQHRSRAPRAVQGKGTGVTKKRETV